MPSAAGPSAAPAAALSATQARFDFHIGFWVNLHQRLYAESGLRSAPDSLHASTTDAQAVWDAAVALYRARYPERGLLTLLTNEELARLNHQLGSAEAAAELSAAGVAPELRVALESAAREPRAWPRPQAWRLEGRAAPRPASCVQVPTGPCARLPPWGARSPVLDHEPTRERLLFIDRLIAQVDAASDVLAKARELPRFMVETPESEQERNLLWFVYDPGIPAEIAEALLGLRRSETAFVLLRAAADYWTPTVLRTLALAWADEYEKYARYVAGLPSVNVTMIPEENKVRVAELVTKQKQTLEHLRAEGDKAIVALGR